MLLAHEPVHVFRQNSWHASKLSWPPLPGPAFAPPMLGDPSATLVHSVAAAAGVPTPAGHRQESGRPTRAHHHDILCRWQVQCTWAPWQIRPSAGPLSCHQGLIANLYLPSCRLAPPFLGSYVASKHGLEGMAASLRRELMLFGIDVIIIGTLFAPKAVFSRPRLPPCLTLPDRCNLKPDQWYK